MLLPLLQNLQVRRLHRFGGAAKTVGDAFLRLEVLKALSQGRKPEKKGIARPAKARSGSQRAEVVPTHQEASLKPVAASGVAIPARLAEYPSLVELIRMQELERALEAIRIALEVLDEEDVLLLLLASQ